MKPGFSEAVVAAYALVVGVLVIGFNTDKYNFLYGLSFLSIFLSFVYRIFSSDLAGTFTKPIDVVHAQNTIVARYNFVAAATLLISALGVLLAQRPSDWMIPDKKYENQIYIGVVSIIIVVTWFQLRWHKNKFHELDILRDSPKN